MPSKKVKPFKKSNLPTVRDLILTLVLLVLLVVYIQLQKSSTFQNTACTQKHSTTSQLPTTLKTAENYFDAGNYYYDTGDCVTAVVDYSKAVKLNPKYAEAYNNLGYTYMMMGDYAHALPALNKAIENRPTYVHALMNRGDLYNYSYLQNRKLAIADYDKIVSQGEANYSDTSVCGHRMIAIHNGLSLNVFLQLILHGAKFGCQVPSM